MDLLSLLRTLGGLGVVLGLLAGALWAVRRYDIKLPGRVGGGAARRLDVVERLAIDGKRSVALIRRDGCEHLVLLDPAGAVVIEGGIGRDLAMPLDEPLKAHAPVVQPKSFSPAATASEPVPAPSAAEDDIVPFQEALSRIQERARRMRASGEAERAAEALEQPHA